MVRFAETDMFPRGPSTKPDAEALFSGLSLRVSTLCSIEMSSSYAYPLPPLRLERELDRECDADAEWLVLFQVHLDDLLEPEWLCDMLLSASSFSSAL
jgi:hypothetical protein